MLSDFFFHGRRLFFRQLDQEKFFKGDLKNTAFEQFSTQSLKLTHFYSGSTKTKMSLRRKFEF